MIRKQFPLPLRRCRWRLKQFCLRRPFRRSQFLFHLHPQFKATTPRSNPFLPGIRSSRKRRQTRHPQLMRFLRPRYRPPLPQQFKRMLFRCSHKRSAALQADPIRTIFQHLFHLSPPPQIEAMQFLLVNPSYRMYRTRSRISPYLLRMICRLPRRPRTREILLCRSCRCLLFYPRKCCK